MLSGGSVLILGFNVLCLLCLEFMLLVDLPQLSCLKLTWPLVLPSNCLQTGSASFLWADLLTQIPLTPQSFN